MKVLILIAALILSGPFFYAQSGKKALAEAETAYYASDFEKAKKYIEIAITDDRINGKSDVWWQRVLIYEQLGSNLRDYAATLNNATIMVESLDHCWKKREKGKVDAATIKSRIQMYNNALLSSGVQLFNEKLYKEAIKSFELAIRCAETIGKKDDLAVFNCGLAAERMENWSLAAEYYEKCAARGYKEADAYYFLSYVYGQAGNSEKVLDALDRGLKKYPGNQSLIISRVNWYLNSGQSEDALEYLKKALVNDPNNEVLHFSIGTVYEKLDGEFDKSIAAYDKALEINPNYFSPLFNKGALFFNKANELNQTLLDASTEEYNEGQKKMKVLFEKAKDSFEKALPLAPDDFSKIGVVDGLMSAYIYLDMTEKYKEMKEMKKQLQGY